MSCDVSTGMSSDRMKCEKFSALFSKTVRISTCLSDRHWFCVFHRLAIQGEIDSISSHQKANVDNVHRQMILFALDLLCRYLLALEHLIIDDDQQQRLGTPNAKKPKRSIQTCQVDWYINERDEVLYLFTNFIKLDLRQFWHETERLEDQQIGK